MFILRSRKTYRPLWLFLCGSLVAAAAFGGVTSSHSLVVIGGVMAGMFLLVTLLSIFSAGQSGLTGMSLLPEWKPKQDRSLLKQGSR